ncbi:hypothetical protein FA95DRAFT_1567464 [Auriscalpium vulgare]|uniref:Uncharacterized protein n=1 Tax=Auriscalpium vulgare TaxID=40419 RepID=A0ACB8R4R7_9AGAM|nr:hypothetical protein FA95DRAFT_1567464 [Auriscalpium vulgare]
MLPDTLALALSQIQDLTNWTCTMLLFNSDSTHVLKMVGILLPCTRTSRRRSSSPSAILPYQANVTTMPPSAPAGASASAEPNASPAQLPNVSANDKAPVRTSRPSAKGKKRASGTKRNENATVSDDASGEDDDSIKDFEADSEKEEPPPVVPIIGRRTSYEQMRFDNIARNKQLLIDAGFGPSDKPLTREEIAAAERAIEREKLAAVPVGPPRHSERIRSKVIPS